MYYFKFFFSKKKTKQYCVANLRGGGEFGQKWHHAGTKERKQNVFDDFFAVQKHLVTKQYTSGLS